MIAAHADIDARFWGSFACALLLHAAVGISLKAGRAAPPRPITSEVELIAAAPPDPPPPAAELPQAAPPEAPPKPMRKSIARPLAPAPLPAPPSAAPPPAVLTSAAQQPGSEPVRFATDPDGRSFGSGVVGRATPPPSAARPDVPAAATGLVITPEDQLERQPSLLSAGCGGYFPNAAQLDSGRVVVLAVVDAAGALVRCDVQSESPVGQGFAAAARACLRNQRFAAARDRHGRAAAARTLIELSFTR